MLKNCATEMQKEAAERRHSFSFLVSRLYQGLILQPPAFEGRWQPELRQIKGAEIPR